MRKGGRFGMITTYKSARVPGMLVDALSGFALLDEKGCQYSHPTEQESGQPEPCPLSSFGHFLSPYYFVEFRRVLWIK
jgi:hypothetical protein